MSARNIDPKTGLGFNNKRGYRRGTPEYNRNHGLWTHYRITLQEWEALFDAQGRVCAVCGEDNPRGKNWHTDHSRTTKKIRGILCGSCNTGIGKFRESEEIMKKAAKYLNERLL